MWWTLPIAWLILWTWYLAAEKHRKHHDKFNTAWTAGTVTDGDFEAWQASAPAPSVWLRVPPALMGVVFVMALICTGWALGEYASFGNHSYVYAPGSCEKQTTNDEGYPDLHWLCYAPVGMIWVPTDAFYKHQVCEMQPSAVGPRWVCK